MIKKFLVSAVVFCLGSMMTIAVHAAVIEITVTKAASLVARIGVHVRASAGRRTTIRHPSGGAADLLR